MTMGMVPVAFFAARAAWLVGATEVLPGNHALARLPALDPRRVATVDTEVGLPSAQAAPAGEARILELAPDDIVVETSAGHPALLVLADRFAAGWSATVDGTPRPIVRADFLLRGVRVGAGQHRVAFHYATPGLRKGGIITAVALPVALLLLIVGFYRTSRRQRQR